MGLPTRREDEVVIEDEAWLRAEPDVEAIVLGAAAIALGPDAAPIAVLLTDNTRIQAMNAQHRGKDAPTNVLAFPAAPMANGPLGDIALAIGVCETEARERGLTLSAHLAHLVVHGALHLMGYDHIEDDEARRMEAKEVELLALMGVQDPYDPPHIGAASPGASALG